MFKVGDKVVAVKHTDYDLTKTEAFFFYTNEMRDLAESQEVMVVGSVDKHRIGCVGYLWHMEDLMLVVPEDLENV